MIDYLVGPWYSSATSSAEAKNFKFLPKSRKTVGNGRKTVETVKNRSENGPDAELCRNYAAAAPLCRSLGKRAIMPLNYASIGRLSQAAAIAAVEGVWLNGNQLHCEESKQLSYFSQNENRELPSALEEDPDP